MHRAFKKIYGNRMTIHRGKVNDYLGMDLDFSCAKTLKIGMIKYIKKIHKDFPEEIKSSAATPAAEHLFTVREDSYLKNKHWYFIILFPNYYSSVHVLDLTHALQSRSYVREQELQMKMTGVS